MSNYPALKTPSTCNGYRLIPRKPLQYNITSFAQFVSNTSSLPPPSYGRSPQIADENATSATPDHVTFMSPSKPPSTCNGYRLIPRKPLQIKKTSAAQLVTVTS